jgi:hypothetical protein
VKSRGEAITSILARMEENATKLALIRAVSRDPIDPAITEEDATWGVMLSRHCAELTIRESAARVSENPIEMVHKRALKILTDAGKAGMSRRAFVRKTQFMDHRQRAGVLNTLKEAELIEMFVAKSKQREVDWLRLLSN